MYQIYYKSTIGWYLSIRRLWVEESGVEPQVIPDLLRSSSFSEGEFYLVFSVHGSNSVSRICYLFSTLTIHAPILNLYKLS